MPRKAIIIGAGPAGLTAAYELLKRTDMVPIILERSGDIGGISKTVNFKGNRIDIGGHRFFSKSDRVMQWWLNIMPIQPQEQTQFTITYQRQSRTIKQDEPLPRVSDKEQSDKVMLVRKRLSRIYFLRKFFAYPIQLSLDTLRKLGIVRTVWIMTSYLKARVFPRKPEQSLEDFFINRFGKQLYLLFFKDYTEKVWGVPCSKISAEWGAQRIKGISIAKALSHALKSIKLKTNTDSLDIAQKGTETSLIEKFLYPKYGPGQLWEEVARQVIEMGGAIHVHHRVTDILSISENIHSVITVDSQTGQSVTWEGDYFFSTMPVKDLISGMGSSVPKGVQDIAAGLQYRDFITVGILLKTMPEKLPDTWIYIQERDVKVGRLQIFNNWSPYMVKDPGTLWIGMEYFCNTSDAIWQSSDEDIKAAAIEELEKMGLAKTENVLDSVVLRVEKTYPAYFGTYEHFQEIRQYTDQFANLFLVGRNGMHKYNNSDHSMLTAMVAVDNIAAGITEKTNIWSINTEQEYHEEKAETKSQSPVPASKSAASPSLKDFILGTHLNRAYLWIAGVAILGQFLIFKHFYPRIGFIYGDSFVYLQTAYHNLDINIYPTGYPKFLRIFSAFTSSDTLLVAFQYLMLQVSSLYFYFTLLHFYRPGKAVQVILFVFLVFNPAFLYLSNYVLSDALFIPLSITWFTLLIWILNRPSKRLLYLQAIILFLAFTVRYNALVYPIIGSIAILLSPQKLKVRLTGVVGSFVLIGLFILFTGNKYKELVGIWEFSPFSGWQIANNAMYAYRYVSDQDVKPVPERFKELDKMIRTYYDSTRDLRKHPTEMLKASTVYMWDPHAPLQKYMHLQFKHDTSATTLKKWSSQGPLYTAYGNWLIRNYPDEFATNYLWPNMLKFYAPPVEFLETYNSGRDTVMKIAQAWFHWKDNKAKTLFKDYKVSALNFFPTLVGALHAIFLFSFLFFLLLTREKASPIPASFLWLVGSLWLINFGFSVFASPIALRFQIFPILVTLASTLLLIQYIWQAAFIPDNLKTYDSINSVAQQAALS